MKNKLSYILLLVCFLFFSHNANSQEIPRVILGLYNQDEPNPNQVNLHRIMQMPLNFYGYELRLHNMNDPLPDPDKLGNVKGVITWFEGDNATPVPDLYLKWAIKMMEKGKKFVVLGNLGFMASSDDPFITSSPYLRTKFLDMLGVESNFSWINNMDTAYISDIYDNAFEYEHKMHSTLPSLLEIHPKDDYRSYATISFKNKMYQDLHPAFVTKTGGYIAPGYFIGFDLVTEKIRWIIDPLKFFKEALATDDLIVKPETTTMNGLRVFYSHIDGDGWMSISDYKYEDENKKVPAIKELIDRVYRPYDDFPVTIGVIAGDIDPEIAGTKEAQKHTVEVLSLPNTEVASHTYTHPYLWSFFEDYSTEKELPYLKKYNSMLFSKQAVNDYGDDEEYTIPRTYLEIPYDTKNEVVGAIDFIKKFSPPDKDIRLVQWSGNTSPFEDVLKEVRENNFVNINGGDGMYDGERSSLVYIAGKGLRIGNELQVYSSNANENLYTNLWSGPFYGYKNLIHTVKNTEFPIRFLPFNMYYHGYSGEKMAAVNAVTSLLDYARTQELIPIHTSDFVDTVIGFFDAKITKRGKNIWDIENHKKLVTLRVDKASFKSVDFAKSKCVIGQRHFQSSLYIALQPDCKKVTVALKDIYDATKSPKAHIPYIFKSNWVLKNVKLNNQKVSFNAKGFGEGKISLQMPENNGKYTLRYGNKSKNVTADKNGMLNLIIPKSWQGYNISITRKAI